MARLTKQQWIEAEEMYRQGFTQKDISKRFNVRVETVSIHMNKRRVKPGENEDAVRREIQAALQKKLREFSEKRADRQIDTKEKLYTITNTLLAIFVRELKSSQGKGEALKIMGGSAKALKESLMSMKMIREELYTILDIKPDDNVEELPELGVSTLTPDEEQALREAKTGDYDDDDIEDLLAQSEDLVTTAEEEAEPIESEGDEEEAPA
jgi:hypothetical protein